MAVFTWDWETPAPAECRRACVSIGNFDGVHRGHAALLGQLQRLAQAQGTLAVALTFDPPPLALLRPSPDIRPLTTLADRCAHLQKAGAAHVLVLQTRRNLLELAAPEFFQRLLCRELDVQGMVEGPNFCFGRNREGTIETLRHLCRDTGVSLGMATPVAEDGGIISSSRIRKALLQGEVANARRWLGRDYAIAGVVGEGAQRGRQIGFPTANLEQAATLLPGDGVYAVRVWHAGRTWSGAANVGPNPTFAEQQRKVEVHLLDFSGDLYGQTLTVQFVARLRDTRKFASMQALSEQLTQDIAQARSALNM